MRVSMLLLAWALGGSAWLTPAPSSAAAAPQAGDIQVPGEIQVPGDIQVPGEIRSPRGQWQLPRPIQEVVPADRPCEVHYVAAADALFEFASASLDADGERALAEVLAQIRQRAPGTVRVRGHTDAIGPSRANLALSAARAQAVGDWLLKRLGQPVDFEFEAVGEKEPLAPNRTASGDDDPLGRARNRRVEIILIRPNC